MLCLTSMGCLHQQGTAGTAKHCNMLMQTDQHDHAALTLHKQLLLSSLEAETLANAVGDYVFTK